VSGSKAGGIKMKATLLKRLGSEEAVREFRRGIGQIGGSKSRNGGFGSQVVGKDGLTGRERAIVVGAKGGLVKSANYNRRMK
jgi:hypothetical protein